MKFRELHILADENISPKIVAFLRNEGLDVLDTKEQGWQHSKLFRGIIRGSLSNYVFSK